MRAARTCSDHIIVIVLKCVCACRCVVRWILMLDIFIDIVSFSRPFPFSVRSHLIRRQITMQIPIECRSKRNTRRGSQRNGHFFHKFLIEHGADQRTECDDNVIIHTCALLWPNIVIPYYATSQHQTISILCRLYLLSPSCVNVRGWTMQRLSMVNGVGNP